MAIGPVEANPDLTARCIAMLAPHRDEREMPARHGRWTVRQLPVGGPRAALILVPIKRLSLFKRILAAVLPCCFRRFRFECGMNDFNQHLANTFRLLRGMSNVLAARGEEYLDANVALDDLIAQCRQMRADAMWAMRDDETYRAVVLEGFQRYLSTENYFGKPAAISAVLQSLQGKLEQRPEMLRQMVREDPALDWLLQEVEGEDGSLNDPADSEHGMDVAEKAEATDEMSDASVDSIRRGITDDVFDVVTDPTLASKWLSDFVPPENVERCCKAAVDVADAMRRAGALTETLRELLTERIVSNSGKEPTDAFRGNVSRASCTAIYERRLVTKQIPKKLWTALKNLAADSKSNPSPNIGRYHLGRFVDAYSSVHHIACMSWPDEAPTGKLDSGKVYARMLRLAKESYAFETEEGKKTLAKSAEKLLPNIGDAQIYSNDWHDADTGFVTDLLNFLIDGGHAAV